MNKKKSFSEKFEQLESIYQKIKELDDADLNELIVLYQEGLGLTKELEKEISTFEQKITEITSGINKIPESSTETTTEEKKTSKLNKKIKEVPNSRSKDDESDGLF